MPRTVRAIGVALAIALVAGAGTALAQVAGTLQLNPSSGPPGTSVNASGTFAGACAVNLRWEDVGGPALGQATTGRNGGYATTIVIPGSATVGDHQVVAVGLVADPDGNCAMETSTVVTQTFTVTPVSQVATLNLSPTSGPPGTSVAASGVFTGTCGVRLHWDAAAGPILGQPSTGADGSYATMIVIPGSAVAGDHLVAAVGMTPDPDGSCAVETGTVVTAPFAVTPSGSGLTADLRLPAPQARPGQGIVVDASASIGQIASFDFDLDGNGSFETSCGGSKAAAVHNGLGSYEIGLRVVDLDGQVATDTAVLEIVGAAFPPPPNPDGGSFTPFEEWTIVGTCVDDLPDLDAIIKAWTCPETVIVGVAEATFRKWGINPAAPDACFERHEEPFLFGSTITFFVASKNKSDAVGNPVLINGLEFDHPAEVTYPKPFYRNEIALVESIPLLTTFGPFTGPKTSDFRISVFSPGFKTSFASEPFSLLGAWDISDPGVVGSVVMGKLTYLTNNEFLGLRVAKKLTPISFDGGHRATFPLHLTLPLGAFNLASLPTSAIGVVTENNGGHPIALPAGGMSVPTTANPPPLTFTGVKLGIFTVNATIAYTRQGSSDVWSGDMELIFQGGVEVDGTLVIKDGAFESAHVGVGPGPPVPPGGLGPIGCCVWIYELFGDLTPLYVGVGAEFGIGPTIPGIGVRAAEVTGTAKIFYGDPWAFVVDVANLHIAGIQVNANAQVMISSNGFMALAFIDEDYGVLEVQANVQASVTSSTWFAGGGGTVCVDLEVLSGCGGGFAGVGKDGLAACAVIPYIPDGGVALGWDFFVGDLTDWSMWWGCAFSDVKSEVTAAQLALARRAGMDDLVTAAVDVVPGLPRALFAIRGTGAAPKVTLTGPDGLVIGSAPDEPVNSGAGWDLIELPHDDTTYVSIEDPAPGTWQIEELAGSAPIASIGLAEGLPGKVAKGSVTGTGRTRTLHYDVADLDGVRVTFVERGGDPESDDPAERVEQVIGSVDGGEGKIVFTPAEGSVRERTIEAIVEVNGAPGETEQVATFTAPPLTPLAAPRVSATRRGSTAEVSWTRVRGAAEYRLVIERGDGPTEVVDVPRNELEASVDGITPLTTAVIAVQAISSAGYFGESGEVTLKALPALNLARKGTTADVLAARGWKVRCVAPADGTCGVEITKGGTVIARGEVAISYAERETFLTRLTNAGKKVLRAADGKLRLAATITVPGRAPETVRLVLTG